MVETTNDVAEAIASDPRLWLEPEFQQLSKFACKVTNSPRLLPPPSIQNHPTPNA